MYSLRHFGRAGRIAFGHFRDVSGTAMDFVETFNDQGKTDKVAVGYLQGLRAAALHGTRDGNA
jgi:D-mannonate dehydratase